MNINIKDRIIARKLIVYILLCSTLITLIFTSYQLYQDYHLGREHILDTMQDIEDTSLQAITRNAWTSNEEQLSTQLQGIIKLHDMQYVRLELEDTVLEAGQRKEEKSLARRIPLSFTFDNVKYELGTLYMSATLENVYQRLYDQAVYILLTQGIKIFLVSGFIFFIFHYLVTRHLYEIVRFVQNLDINKLDTPLSLDRPSDTDKKADELDQVVNSFNEMSSNLAGSYASLNEEIAERKKAEETLLKNNTLLSEAERMASVGSWQWDIISNEFIFSAQWQQNLGVTKSILSMDDLMHIAYPDDTEAINKAFQDVLNGVQPKYDIEHRIIRQDNGEVRFVRAIGEVAERSESGEPLKMFGFAQDITERKRAEKDLQESEENLRLIYNTAGDVLFQLQVEPDNRFRFLSVNKAFLTATGLTEEQILGKTTAEVIPEQSHSLVLRKYIEAIQEKRMVTWEETTEYPSGRKVGAVAVTPAFDPDGNCTHLIGSVHDITERKKAEEELKVRHSLLVGVMEGTTDAVFVKDVEGRYIIINEATSRAMGKSVNEIIGKTDMAIFSTDAGQQLMEIDKKIMSEGKTQSVEEYTMSGNVKRLWQTTKGVYRDAEGKATGIFGVARDITERRQLEEERQKAHKLESIGILAGGIAHDFNNLLAAIRNNVYLSKILSDRESEVYENMESTEKILHRATNLTQQLLTFAKGGTPVKKISSIIELIKESAEFVMRGSNVKCEYNVADNIWPVEVDEGQMNQVIHNLILNGVQSMPKGGTIRISTENSNLTSEAAIPLQEGKYVKIVIQDEGIGIAEEDLKNVFDPYFTTKEMGRGLGLSTTYSIINNHGGHISVESIIGTGTTFTIYLPASEKQFEEIKKIEDISIAGKGKVLIMDDEEVIRTSVEKLLTYSGYEIECAEDGDEAIARYKKAMEASKPFDAVMLDLTVRGGMGGKEAVKKLREIDPNVKAIVASGYSNDPVLANFKEYGFVGVFAKHDETEELGKTLHRVIKG